MYYLLVKKGLPQTNDNIISGECADSIWGLGAHYLLGISQRVPFGLLTKYPVLKLLKTGAPAGGLRSRIISQLIRMRTAETDRDRYLNDPEYIRWSIESWVNEEWVCRYFNVNRSDIIRNRFNTISN